jgi:D-proline reductase (dithiol) PrdB
MVRIAEMDAKLAEFMLGYRWRGLGEIAPARLRRSLDECRVALISSAGMIAPGQKPYDQKVRGGDWTWREIAGDIDVATLTEHHNSKSFDHSGIEADRNMGMPLDRLRDLAADGVTGRVAPRHASVMGSITAPGRFLRKTVLEIVETLTADEVDVAIMVPV